MPMEVDARATPLRKSKDGTGREKERPRQSHRGSQGTESPATCVAKQDTLRKIAGNGRCKPRESRMARAKEMPRARMVVMAKGM